MLQRKALKKISKKRQAQLYEFWQLRILLEGLCHNSSELSGKNPTWESNFLVEPHHIDGRTGKRLLDPFNIIMLTRNEHTIEQQHKEGCHTKEELLALVKKIRVKQGFKEVKDET